MITVKYQYTHIYFTSSGQTFQEEKMSQKEETHFSEWKQTKWNASSNLNEIRFMWLLNKFSKCPQLTQ